MLKSKNPLIHALSAIALLVLFLQFTDTYKLLLIAINRKTQFASIISMTILLIFVTVNWPSFIELFKQKLFRKWFHLIFTFPICLIFIHLILNNLTIERYIYWTSFIVFVSLIFITSTLFFSRKNSFKLVNKFYFLALLSVIISFVIGFINYDILRAIMAISTETEDFAYIRSESSRAIGFFTQPNIAARAVFAYSLVLFGSYFEGKNHTFTSLFIFLILVMIVLTGSRTGLILFGLFLIFYLPRSIFKKIFKRSTPSNKFYRLLIYLSIPLIFLILLSLLPSLIDTLKGMNLNDLADRFASLNILDTTDSLSNDRSVEYRLKVIEQYIDKIFESPVIGYGPETRETYLKNGTFIVASQNEYLENLFSYGIVYTLYFLHVFYWTIKNLKWQAALCKGKVSYLRIFLLILIIYGFSVNYLLINKIILIVLGTFIGITISSKLNAELKYK